MVYKHLLKNAIYYLYIRGYKGKGRGNHLLKKYTVQNGNCTCLEELVRLLPRLRL